MSIRVSNLQILHLVSVSVMVTWTAARYSSDDAYPIACHSDTVRLTYDVPSIHCNILLSACLINIHHQSSLAISNNSHPQTSPLHTDQPDIYPLYQTICIYVYTCKSVRVFTMSENLALDSWYWIIGAKENWRVYNKVQQKSIGKPTQDKNIYQSINKKLKQKRPQHQIANFRSSARQYSYVAIPSQNPLVYKPFYRQKINNGISTFGTINAQTYRCLSIFIFCQNKKQCFLDINM